MRISGGVAVKTDTRINMDVSSTEKLIGIDFVIAELSRVYVDVALEICHRGVNKHFTNICGK